MFARRPDPAGVLLPGRRRHAVRDCQPPGSRPGLRTDAGARGMAKHRARLPWDLPPLAGTLADLLDVRGHAHADRPRLRRTIPARVRAAARTDRRVRRDPHRLLGGVRPLPAARTGLRLHAGWRAGGLAASLFGVPRALQQELQSLVGVRHAGPEPVPAGEAVSPQPRPPAAPPPP